MRKTGQISGFWQRAENLWNMKLDNCNSSPWNGHQRAGKRDLVGWRLEEELKPYRSQLYECRLGYLEESWRPQVTYCHSDSSETPSVKADVKNSQGLLE